MKRGPLQHVALAFAVLGSAVMAGCSTVGPASIAGGRAAYNQAITSTGDQQLLGLIVKHRYAENAQLLAVSSVTANMRVSARMSADVGFGPDRNFSGNLVPLSTGVMVEENPTISYVPIEGERFLREMMSPVPIELALLLISSSDRPTETFCALITNVNDIPNHSFAGPDAEADQRFARVIELVGQLSQANAISWRIDGPADGASSGYAIVLHWPAGLDGEAQELLTLLGQGETDKRRAVLRLGFGDGSQAEEGSEVVWLGTRSISEMVRVASAGIDVAQAHQEQGLANPPRALGEIGKLIHVRSSKDRPNDAYVAYEQHGWWYSISEADTVSKRYFNLLNKLISVRLADTARRSSAVPLLTIPTAR